VLVPVEATEHMQPPHQMEVPDNTAVVEEVIDFDEENEGNNVTTISEGSKAVEAGTESRNDVVIESKRLIMDRPYYPEIEDVTDEDDDRPRYSPSPIRTPPREYYVYEDHWEDRRYARVRDPLPYLRDRRDARHDSSGYPPEPNWLGLTFFWASQIDVENGYWATPWKNYFREHLLEGLSTMVDVGFAGIRQSITLKDPERSFAGDMSHEIRYVTVRDEIILGDLSNHLRRGGHTWPPYAVNARGGILKPEPHQRIKFVTFDEATESLPPLLLLRSVLEVHESKDRVASQALALDRTIELASLDHWLSWAAKTRSIQDGELNLQQHTPTIIEDIWRRFATDFMDIRHSRRDTGDEGIIDLAESISKSLLEVKHSPAEHYFIWVAFLRTVKVLQCISEGTDTFDVQNDLEEDLLVYLT
jgi:hypothetical protein